MKTSVILSLCLLLIAALSLTGFQCGSAESTSAKLYMQRGDWPAAEKALMKEVEKNPANAEAWYLLGDVRRQKSDFKGMNEAFDASLKINKEWESKIKTTRLSVWGTMLNQGVAAYNKSTTAPKDSAASLRSSAIESYKNALLVNPDSAITYQNMAIAQMAQGNVDEEIKYLKLALDKKADPQYSTYLINAYVTKAEDAKKANNKAEADLNFANAIGTLTAARASDPKNQELLSLLINLYIEAGKAPEAMPFIKEAVTNDPKNKVFQNDLGLLMMQTGDIAGAVDHFSAAVAVDSSYTDALRNGAVAMMKLGQKMKDEASAGDPKKSNVNKAYQAKFKEAAGLLEKYLTIKQDDADVWQALATAYGGADMTKQAMNALKKADALTGKK